MRTLVRFVSLAFTLLATATAAQIHLERIKLWHVVIVHLNNPGDAEARQRLIDASHTFRQIKGVEAVYVGKMIPGDRPHQDSSARCLR